MEIRELGLAAGDRAVIIHADDIGMCQASVSAFAELWEAGRVSSGSTMVPCSWFPHAAAYCRAHPGVDMGILITLTSEWDTYRWGPISTRDQGSGMLDAEGYFLRSSQPMQFNADPAAVQREMQAQVAARSLQELEARDCLLAFSLLTQASAGVQYVR